MHSFPFLDPRNKLPVTQRIQFKQLTLMQGAMHADRPRYLADRVTAKGSSIIIIVFTSVQNIHFF